MCRGWCRDELLLRLLLIAALGASTGAAADDGDVPGSADPLGLPRVPHSTIVRFEDDDQLLTREFVVGRVDKTRREIRVKNEIRTEATLQSATYQMPEGVRTQEVIDHYLNLLAAGELFSCRGRDCGRSNDWANYIFKQAILYGPDTTQFYFAGEYGEDPMHLVGLYVIQRGSRRMYAHLQVLTPAETVSVESNQNLATKLSSEGFAIVEGVQPGPDGSLDPAALAVLEQVSNQLTSFAGQQVYVVCHLFGALAVDELLSNAATCSETAVSQLQSDNGPSYQPFAAGPLLPGRGSNVSRIELVVPHRLDHN